ncbi:MAG TPA: hypothetical protein VJM33_18425 [Microthrixaceae bacterium]|nr:hypothetical protein [Microthrixaceae bacterium]
MEQPDESAEQADSSQQVDSTILDPDAQDVDGPSYTWTDHDLAEARRVPRWVLPLLVLPIIGLVVANNVGAIWLTNGLEESNRGLLEHPLLILALNSTNKMLLATGFQTDAIGFYPVAGIRLLIPDPLFYLLGALYRRPAIRWGRGVYPGADRLFDLFEAEDHRGVRRLLDVLVLIMPNNPVSLLAGVAGMPFPRFLVLNITGTIGRLLIFRQLSFAFRDEIQDFMGFLARYQRWALIITVVVVVISFVVQARRMVSSTEALADED